MANSDTTPAEAALRVPPLGQADILALAGEQIHKAVALADLLGQFASVNQCDNNMRRVLLYNETLPTLMTMLSELLVEVEERIEEASHQAEVAEVGHG